MAGGSRIMRQRKAAYISGNEAKINQFGRNGRLLSAGASVGGDN